MVIDTQWQYIKDMQLSSGKEEISTKSQRSRGWISTRKHETTVRHNKEVSRKI